MISVYKFEHCKTYKVDARVLTEFGTPNCEIKYSFQYVFIDRYSQMITPVPKNTEVIINSDIPHTGKIDTKSFLNTVTDFTFKNKVYLHPNCTIPRAKVTQKYTKSLKPGKADICVVPKLKKEINTENLAIFINKDKNKIYVIETITNWDQGKLHYYTSEKCKNFTLGSSILDINPSLRDTIIVERVYYNDPNINTFSMENWNDFLASTLLYYGPVVSLYTKEFWIIDVLYNKLHDIITEDRLLATLGDSTNEFTKEVYDNLREMLNSRDDTVVGLGLKAVAEMDYEKYRNTAIHLLANNKSWSRNDMRSSTSVKYMLNYLGLWRSPIENYAYTTTQEDFDLMQEVVKNDFKERIKNVNKLFNLRFPFAKLDLSYQFEVSPKLNEENSVKIEKDTENFEEDYDNNDDV